MLKILCMISFLLSFVSLAFILDEKRLGLRRAIVAVLLLFAVSLLALLLGAMTALDVIESS